jgi:pimeloyl-ACP methyl ester carboxylesterase
MQVERRALTIDAGGFPLPAALWAPQSAKGVIIGLEPSDLDRLVARDSYLLEQLGMGGFAVLAFGLLTPEEESSVEVGLTRRFDIEALTARTVKAVDWMRDQAAGAPTGLLAKGTAVAAALMATVRRRLGAIVSVAGRPDLAPSALPAVQSPTLFVTGAEDVPSQHFSQLAADRMHCERDVRVIPGDGLLEHPSEADVVAGLALEWFERHLVVLHDTQRESADEPSRKPASENEAELSPSQLTAEDA